MPWEESLLNLPGMHVEKLEGKDPLHIWARYEGEVVCPRCQGRQLRCKDRFERVTNAFPTEISVEKAAGQ